MKICLTYLIVLLTFQGLYCQKIKAPKTFVEAIEILKKDCPDSLQQIIKQTTNTELLKICYPYGGNYRTIFNWTSRDNKRSKIKKFLIKNGIESNEHQQTVILIGFKNALNEKDINKLEVFEPFIRIEEKWRNEDLVRFTTDSLRGFYIPKDLEDCFNQIDQLWNDTIKTQIQQMSKKDFTGRNHFGFGLWMRNNWQLWGGSRLSKYFKELGIYHPDDMSGIILDSYHSYLTEEELNLEQQVKYYEAYWSASREPIRKEYPKGARKLELDSKLNYTFNESNLPGVIHVQTNSKTNKIWIYDNHFGWLRISDKDLKKLQKENRREETLIEIYKRK